MTVRQAFDLALQHHQSGRLAEAEALYRQILAADPNHAEAWHLLGVIAHAVGRSDLAVEWIQRSIMLAPNYAVAHNNLGGILRSQGRFDEALAAFRQALQLEPHFAEAWSNLGDALRERGQIEEAEDALRRALQINPQLVDAHTHLAAVLAAQSRLGEAEAAYRESLRQRPDQPAVHSSLVVTLLPRTHADEGTHAVERSRWEARFGEPARQFFRPHENDRQANRRLRVGYVSPDFRDHVIARNILPLFKHHDRSQFEILSYSGVVRPDAMTEEFRRRSDHWVDVASMPDEGLVERIRADSIDVLVDLSQHLVGNRLTMFAHRPAPVQVSFAAYPETTGVKAIEYRISDRNLESDGPGVWRWQDDPSGFVPSLADPVAPTPEQVFLLDSFWCYDPAGLDIAVNELPAKGNGYVTFGCLNNPSKVNEEVLRLWARLLVEIPNSRLILLGGFGTYRGRTLEFLARQGVAPQRVEFLRASPHDAYLAEYRRIDLVLDTFPYNGHTTSLDALWMGVPVVSLCGQPAVSRAGWSQMRNLGLPDLVARSEAEFVHLAVALARDLSRLADLRESLRSRMETSVIMDSPKFTRQIEAAYRTMWRHLIA
jgi:predicted O-linked N-acetylglucosamine transferase (SPINDLY family)